MSQTMTKTGKQINGVDVQRLMETVGAIQEDPSLGAFEFRAHNEWIDGTKNRSRIQDFYGAGKEDDTRARPFVLENDEPAVMTALPPLEAVRANSNSAALPTGLPKALLRSSSREAANAAVATLDATGAKAQLCILPAGPDIARGWGRRRSVAEDSLFDSPVMPGSQRVGPDLANVGVRLPDANWHLLHLYAPQHQLKGSTMPPYRYLFERRKIERRPSPDALVLPPPLAPPPGYEVVPRPEATALAAYLVSLRADFPLFNAPMTLPGAAATPAGTNAPVASATPAAPK